METLPSPHPAIDLATPLYYQLVHTLTHLLPPPLDDSPEALRARNHAAIAKVAALLPVNANEADLAAQCIAARAQAEEMLRLIRQNADDIGLVIRLNAQYASMVRTSLSVQGRLMRVQAVRQKREAIEGAASQDAWTLHVAEQSMLQVADPNAEPLQPAAHAAVPAAVPAAGLSQTIKENVTDKETVSQEMAFETWMNEQLWNHGSRGSEETGLYRVADPNAEPLQPAAPEAAPVAVPAAAPPAGLNQTIEENVTENEMISQEMAFETWMSQQLWNHGALGAGETGLHRAMHEAMAGSRSLGQSLSANARESPGMAD